MKLTAPMERVLTYAAEVGTVYAWPDDIKDVTIRKCRRLGLLTTFTSSWNVHPASNVQWREITDVLSERGKELLRGRCRDCNERLRYPDERGRGVCNACHAQNERLSWSRTAITDDHPTRDCA